MQEEGCEEVVKSTWDCNPTGTALFRLAQKIKKTRVQLLLWSQAKVRIIPRLIESTRKKLKVLEEQTQESYDAAEVNLVRRELHSLLAKEETHWRQRSRVSWLREGDRNSKFYHACASQRKRTNTIVGLRDPNGIWQESHFGISNTAIDYFNNLFTSSNNDAVAEVTQNIDPVVSPDMNNLLLQPFSDEEIKKALFQMSPSKAPVPDGMTALFFQKFWNIVGHDVTFAVLDFLNKGKMLGSINFTHITLIPKVKSPESMS